MEVRSCLLGPYTGLIASSYDTPEFRAWLKDIFVTRGRKWPGRTGGGHGIHVITAEGCEAEQSVVIKAFARQFLLKDRLDERRRSKAHRSFRAGCALREREIGTPMPIVCLDWWERHRLIESYLVTRYEPDMAGFREELIHLYRHDPDCGKLMFLLECVARAVRNMHDAGFFHRDLGNQNILLRRKGDGEWGDVMFIDLNRSRIRKTVSLRERAFDLSRITLPSDLLRVFQAMYFAERPPPRAFTIWEQYYRKRFAWHTRSRPLRHPVRSRRRAREEDPRITYPPVKDIWIWDERSVQAIGALRSRDRRRYFPPAHLPRLAVSSVPAAPSVFRRYRKWRMQAYQEPMDMRGKAALAIAAHPDTWEQEREWLAPLGRLPLMIRWYHHRGPTHWDFTARCIRELHDAGFPLSIALVQDRRAVREPERWDAFVRQVLEAAAGRVEWVEVGHAINRVKWGIWDVREYLRLLMPLSEYAGNTSFRFMGPAVIDFEYHYLVDALKRMAGSFRFDALSHHLYVDRRGAPENRQAGFSTLEKCALARAIADWAPSCEPRLIVSEVNWPILGTGEYSPVGSPYCTPGPRRNDPGVTEDEYADYMIRYLVIALASGMAERVYWWRLAAHGFGLIDDRDPVAWRARPAFQAFRHFLDLLGDSTFVRKIPSPEGSSVFLFRRPDGEDIVLAYAHPKAMEYLPKFSFDEVRDALNGPATVRKGRVPLTGRPVYFRRVQEEEGGF